MPADVRLWKHAGAGDVRMHGDAGGDGVGILDESENGRAPEPL
ncbi:hypothetical protein ACTWPT_34620 [Nonomuraea sp. 3N208]